MPIGTTNISTTLVRNKLGESTNDVGTLCTSPKINRWSRRKPVRNTSISIPADQVGQDADGNWGLTIPGYDGTDTQLWVYNKPIDSIWPKRLGDFRGYYHNAKIPMIVQSQPESVYEEFMVYTFIVQSNDHSIGLDDFFEDNLNLGVEVFNQNGTSLGWGSSESIVEINVSLYVPAVTKISAKFFLTDEKKDFGLHPAPARWALPRERSDQNKFWSDVPVVNNPPTSDYFTIEAYNPPQTPQRYTVRIGNIPSNVSNMEMIFRPPQGIGIETTHLLIRVALAGDFEVTRELPVTPGTVYDVELYFPPHPAIQRRTTLITPDVIIPGTK